MEIRAIGHLVKADPIKANRRPLAGNPKHECRNPKQGRWSERDLKKQSQFAGSLNGRNFNNNKGLRG
jgi:hypothetical protein